MVDLPTGYIAPRPGSDTFAVDSATLSKNGEVHTGNGTRLGFVESGAGWGELLGLIDKPYRLDSFVELDIDGDKRLDTLRKYARAQGKLHGDPSSPKYIANIKDREKILTDLLTKKVYEIYGSYSQDTFKNLNTEERDARGDWVSNRRTTHLATMEKDSLVCRHYAPIMSVLLDEAGVPNHLIHSYTCETTMDNGQYALNPNGSFTGYHAYVITKAGNAIIEGTVAGQKNPDGSDVSAYMPILNGVTTDDIVYHGHAALVDNGHLYGGHLGDGNHSLDRVRLAQTLSLNRYNESLPPPQPSFDELLDQVKRATAHLVKKDPPSTPQVSPPQQAIPPLAAVNPTEKLMRELKDAVNGNGDLNRAYYAARASVDKNNDGILAPDESAAFIKAYEQANGMGSAVAFREAWKKNSNNAASAVAGAVTNPSGNLAEIVRTNLAILDKDSNGKLDSDDQSRISGILTASGIKPEAIPGLIEQVQAAVGKQAQSFNPGDGTQKTTMASGNAPATVTPKPPGRLV